MRRGRSGWATAALALAVIAAAGACASSGAPGGRKAAAQNDNDPQYQVEKGTIALHYGLADEAVRYGELAVALDPAHFNGWNLLGSAHYAKGDYRRSAEAYEKAAALKPGAADVRRNIGLAYAELKETDKAEAAFRAAFELSGDAEAAFLLAKTAYDRKDNEGALEWVLKAIQKDGKKAGYYNLKGAVLNQMERFAEAIGSFQAGLVLAPGDVNLQINLGIAYLNNEEPDKARAVLEKVLPKIEDAVMKARVDNLLKSIKGGQIPAY